VAHFVSGISACTNTITARVLAFAMTSRKYRQNSLCSRCLFQNISKQRVCITNIEVFWGGGGVCRSRPTGTFPPQKIKIVAQVEMICAIAFGTKAFTNPRTFGGPRSPPGPEVSGGSRTNLGFQLPPKPIEPAAHGTRAASLTRRSHRSQVSVNPRMRAKKRRRRRAITDRSS
jgi:hypothetical protein